MMKVSWGLGYTHTPSCSILNQFKIQEYEFYVPIQQDNWTASQSGLLFRYSVVCSSGCSVCSSGTGVNCTRFTSAGAK